MVGNIRNAIRQLAKPDVETVALICKVDQVDKTARTIDCSPINDEAPLLGVNLQANQGSDFGICVFPEVDSYVVVGFISGGASGVVLMYDKIESAEIIIGDTSALISADGLNLKIGTTTVDVDKKGVSFNGGSLGGLVKVKELTERLNLIEEDINKLKNLFNGWAPVSQDGGAALKSAVADWSVDLLELTLRNNYENENVKQ